MFNFQDSVAVVTGGAGYLGSAVSKKFVDAGASVIILDKSPESLSRVKADIDQVHIREIDLLNQENVKNVIQAVYDEFGKIDFLVNIAGGFTMGGRTHETDLSTMEFMFDINAKTMWVTSKHVLMHMVKQKSGRIVNIGARAGLEGKGKIAPYTASKSAVIRFTEGMAKEYKDDGININCILPGTIDTPQNRQDMPNADTSQWVPPANLADVILFLCSPAANSVTGAAIPVYGRGL